jgi:DNA mismatch endonuclease (patch repair protein)
VFESDFIKALKKQTPLKFSVNVTTIAGKPDIVFSEQKVCVFLDSDFWHGWQYPRWKHLLKNKFWRDKIERNRTRDRKITLYLRKKGWTVLRIWEHLINNNGVDQIVKAL